jgi:hypothetical protein
MEYFTDPVRLVFFMDFPIEQDSLKNIPHKTLRCIPDSINSDYFKMDSAVKR